MIGIKYGGGGLKGFSPPPPRGLQGGLIPGKILNAVTILPNTETLAVVQK